jgi:hypothetical protein
MTRFRIFSLGLALAATVAFSGIAGALEIEDLLSSYTGANAEGYFMPFRDAAGSALNSGLYTSGRVPRAGFHFRIEGRGMLVNFGDDDKEFQATAEGGFPEDTTFTAPTVVGSTDAVTIVDPNTQAAFAAPGGIDLDRFALAAPQLVVGSVMGTEAIFRYIAVETGDADIGDISLFGIGARHSISQYLTGFPVDLAAMVFYQKFEVGESFVDANGLTYGIQASKSFGILEPYAGFTLDSFDMNVDYDVTVNDQTVPLELDFERSTNAHLTLGGTLHFAILHLNGELNIADQTGFTFGFGLGR